MLSILLTVAVLHTLAVMSPGPDFIMVVRNAIMSGKKSGIFTALGIAIALLVHIFYSALGIGLIISQSILAFNIIKVFGALYLLFLGWKIWSNKEKTVEVTASKKSKISNWKSFQMGFICNVLNPKAALYFVSLFALVLPPNIDWSLLSFISMEILLITFGWFTLVALFFSISKIQKGFYRFEKLFQKIFGGLLILFGLKVLTSTKD